MADILNVRTISVSIDRTPRDVFDAMARHRKSGGWPHNDEREDGGTFVLDMPEGGLHIKTLYNPDRLTLDEIVEIEPFEETLIAQRVVPNGEGAELIVSVFQPERMADDAFRELVDLMEAAMQSLRRMLEMKGTVGGKLMHSETVSMFVERDPGSVFDFVAEVDSLPQWAMQFIHSMNRRSENWSTASGRGTVRVRLDTHVHTGIADQHIIPAPGRDFPVPVRVLPNNAGSEVTVTVFQPHSMPDRVFRNIVGLVEKELDVLNNLLKLRGFERAA